MIRDRIALLIGLASGCIAPTPLVAQVRYLVTVRDAADTGVVVQRARRLGHAGRSIADRVVLVTEDAQRGRRGLRDSLLTLKRERRTSRGGETLEIEEDVAAPPANSIDVPTVAASWGVASIGAPIAWELGATGQGIITTALDAGGGFGHPLVNIAGGYTALVGADSLAWRTDPNCNSHGIHTASTMSGTEASGFSVAPRSSVYLVRVFQLVGSCTAFTSDQIRGMQWAAANGTRAINVSIGNTYSPSMAAVVADMRARGIIVCGANGNESATAVKYPAGYPDAVGVAAIDAGGARASFSNTGPETDFAAPGVSIIGAQQGGGTVSKTGTSMASPHVCGAFAALMSLFPALPLDSLTVAFQRTADAIGDSIPNRYTGWGRIRLDRAVAYLRGGVATSWSRRDYTATSTDSVLAACSRSCSIATDGPITTVSRPPYVVFTASGPSSITIRSTAP